MHLNSVCLDDGHETVAGPDFIILLMAKDFICVVVQSWFSCREYTFQMD